jgi:hypothetical protein
MVYFNLDISKEHLPLIVFLFFLYEVHLHRLAQVYDGYEGELTIAVD